MRIKRYNRNRILKGVIYVSKKAKARFIFFLVASFALALVISLIIGACFFISLHSTDKPKTVDRYKLSYGYVDAKKTEKYVYSKDIIRNGEMCVNFSDIAEFCRFTTVGDREKVKFYFNNSDSDILEITVGNNIAYVNENPVNMHISPYMIGDSIYLPAEFVLRYFEGISITSDDEKKTVNIDYSDSVECSLRLKSDGINLPLDPDTVE